VGGAFGAPLNVTPTTATALVDSSARRGDNFCYAVRGVVATTPVVVESGPSAEVCLAVQDRFAPVAPTGVAALARAGGVDVSWSPSPEPDLALYRVYRASGGAAAARVAEVKAGEMSFGDNALAAGEHVYTVTAVDRDGNESLPSRPAPVRVP
jgi:fibronectin type 3 domain-containing protein